MKYEVSTEVALGVIRRVEANSIEEAKEKAEALIVNELSEGWGCYVDIRAVEIL